jgi:transposase
MATRKRRQFTAEFKADAVKLVRSGGQRIAQVARNLDLTETALREGVRRAEIEAGEGPPGALTQAEREELVRLRRENKRLQMERDILKKRRPSSRGRASKVPVHTRGEGQLSIDSPLPGSASLQEWVLRIREAGYFESRELGPGVDRSGDISPLVVPAKDLSTAWQRGSNQNRPSPFHCRGSRPA